MSKLVIVTGMSGAGKTQAVRSLEDLGFFCVDNLPPTFIPKFAEMCSHSTHSINNIALVVDIRGGEFFDALSGVLAQLKEQKVNFEIFFLEASDETLVRRYKESRRKHPLGDHGEVLRNIRSERELLEDLRGRADKLIDTSNLTNQQLKGQITLLFGEKQETPSILISVTSFGYKHGIPMDSDLVMDVRFLPNPHYVEELRPFTGNDEKVHNYVMENTVTREFMKKFYSLIVFLIPKYIEEGKTTLMISVGCTGGKHRSVAVANYLGGELLEKNYRVTTSHRDVDKN
ncbi:MAG: RNase adapter RapZ [Clostridiales bacterium]|nr:RNase adapter RapZ [Clostridiales bacterium]MCF8021636.1 RNase adapter RapZ [Clostridiales bacterium]